MLGQPVQVEQEHQIIHIQDSPSKFEERISMTQRGKRMISTPLLDAYLKDQTEKLP